MHERIFNPLRDSPEDVVKVIRFITDQIGDNLLKRHINALEQNEAISRAESLAELGSVEANMLANYIRLARKNASNSKAD